MSVKPDYLGHRKRIRERFINSDGNGLSDYEFLELLLTYAVPIRDVKPIAKKLISSFQNLSGVLDAKRQDLERIGGIGEVSSILIVLVRKIMELYLEERLWGRDVLSSPKLVVDFARLKISSFEEEVFLCIYLNSKNEVVKYKIVQEGTVDQVVLYPRKVIELALLHKASAIILVHNHPSGHTEPSQEDKILTEELISTAKLFDIRVLDHVIVGKGGGCYYSFRENSII